jgi:hypothetical protein
MMHGIPVNVIAAMRRITMTRLFFSAVTMFLLTANSLASVYYVATTGSDSNDGSIDHPWL